MPRKLKGTETDPPERLTDAQGTDIRKWCAEHFPQYSGQLGPMWQECRNYHLANDIQRVRWPATFKNWICKAAKFDAERQGYRKQEKPQEAGPRGELVPLMEIIDGGKK